MDAITILKRCREAPEEIRRLGQRIRQRRDAATGISAPRTDKDGGGQRELDKIGRMLSDVSDLETQMERRRERHAAEKAAACVLLDTLPGLPSGVLYAWYLNRETAAEIARRLHYQASYIRKVKLRGEQALAELPPETVAAALPAWYLREEAGE